MERQAKDGAFYRQVGDDAWEPVTRTAKDGNVYKKVGADEWEPIESPKPTGPDVGDKSRAALEGFADSASFGTVPYLKAAGEVATDYAAEKLLDAPADETKFSDRVDKFRGQGKELQAKAPGYALGGQVAGFVAPGAIASKVVGAGLKAAAKIPALTSAAEAIAGSGRAGELYKAAQAAKEAGKLKSAATLIKAARADLTLQGAKLGAEGAVLGGAYTPETGFTDISARVEGAATGLATGAAMPAALRAGGNVLKGAASAASSVPKKILSALGGVKEEVIDSYLKNPERIRNASSFDELYEQVSGVVKGLQDKFDDSKVGYEAAKSKLDDVAAGIKESRVDGKAKAMEEVQKARVRLDESFSSQKQVLAEKASPSQIEPQINDALSGLKDKLVKGSQASFEILDQDKGGYSVRGAGKQLRALADDMNIKGWAPEASEGLVPAPNVSSTASRVNQSGPVTGQSIGVQNELLRFADLLEQTPEVVPARELKKILRQLDDSEKAAYNTPGFDGRVSQAYKQIRGTIDDALKKANPAYEKKMLDVADDARAFNAAEKKFGSTDSSRFSRLQNVAKPSMKYDLETLKQLGAKDGGELPKAIDEMVGAQRTLKSPMKLENLRQALPENQIVRSAEMQAASAKRLAKPREIQRAIEQSGAFFKERSAEANMKSAKALADKFRGFGEQSAESKLKQVASGRKYATKTLEELSALSDQDFVSAVSAAKDASAFTKSAFNGSRNVNLWTVLGSLATTAVGKGGAGGAVGFVFGGPVGMALGAVTGSMMDVYGPAVTKKILDGVIKTKGLVNARTIEGLDIPTSVKRDLIEQFNSTILSGRAAAESAKIKNVASEDFQPEVKPQEAGKPKGPDKWASDGFEKVSSVVPGVSREAMLADPKMKDLLIQASELKPGSKAFNSVVQKIQSRSGKGES